ncbi:MAG TPA: SDR family oxidoreductase [Candidatus Udaeobacter sp.]|nr:SDR family oxidoreductase [Candidatus Udaeobacter sp.]
MILVTGASGTVGSELLKELISAGESVRAGYRTRPPTLSGVQPLRIDLATGEGLDAAVDGVDAVFLLAGEMEDQAAGEIRVVEAAKRAGVKRLVKQSVFAAEGEAYSFARIHRRIERAVEASGIAYTFLRPGSFMQNFVTYQGETIRTENAFYLPCGDAREGFVDARDIARVAARALTRDGYEGKAYDLLGPEALTYGDAAAKLSAALGRTVNYVSVPEAEFKKAMIGTGLPEPSVDRLVDLYRFIREEHPPTQSTAIKDVTGRDPISFDQFAHDYADAWRINK